ncbi:MAG: hypothetical protein EXR54_04320 [Dehalococcoidia bacterium]|nr:hypothetical protein [Dehalococcoidia bacterium]MSQ16776.1 hypothetical protein [Dehalococcoidia bacterium]
MAVTKLEIKSRQPFAGGKSFGKAGTYEQLDGTAHFAVDPELPANGVITDLKLAPRNRQGQATFTADFRILKPVESQSGNHKLLLDVLNRGRQRALAYFNLAPDRAADAPQDPGDGLLMRHGYTTVWCGWQHDVPETPGLMRVAAPEARTADGPVSGPIAVTFQLNAPAQVQLLADRQHQPYSASNLKDPDAVLTVQDYDDAPPRIIPRDQWSFARMERGRPKANASHIHLASGFEAGKVYQVNYTTTGAPVVGVGLLATRDLVSFLRNEEDTAASPCAGSIQHAYAFGASQSGRVLRQFLHLGLNQDESDRMVFDGMIAHIAGGRRGEFNQRFGQPSSVVEQSTSSLFPFADIAQTDPETKRADGLLARLAAQNKLPKIMFTNSSAEYWGGHAALSHIDLAGVKDLKPFDSVRIYYFAGTQHASGTYPLTDQDANNGAHGRQLFNCVDYKPLLRAALVRLDRWVTSGELPPASRHPRVDDSTAIRPERLAAAFKVIPGVEFPAHLRHLHRLDFGPDEGVITKLPPAIGKPYPNLVSAVDRDGNDIAGIRLPEISVPLATHTGWNVRHSDIGGAGQMLRQLGSTIPFPANRVEREDAGDPRRSIDERYPSKKDYTFRVRLASQDLVSAGYLLVEDVERLVTQAGERYDMFRSLARSVPRPVGAGD